MFERLGVYNERIVKSGYVTHFRLVDNRILEISRTYNNNPIKKERKAEIAGTGLLSRMPSKIEPSV